jgi:hypothetical protein
MRSQTCQRTQYLTAFEYLPNTGNKRTENGEGKPENGRGSDCERRHGVKENRDGFGDKNSLYRIIG